MLLQNGTRLAQNPLTPMGGGVAVDAVIFNRGSRLNRVASEQYSRTAATPNGHLPPSAWVLPVRAGGMSSYLPVTGAGNISAAQIAAGLNAIADLTGSGNIINAALALVTSAIANLSGSGGLSASIVGRLEATAAIAGAGDVQATIGALASLLATLTGMGALAGQPFAKAFMSGNIRGYSDLTPEGLRDAVWGATAVQNNIAGSMGEKLNSAASGGVDYTALADAVWSKTLP